MFLIFIVIGLLFTAANYYPLFVIFIPPTAILGLAASVHTYFDSAGNGKIIMTAFGLVCIALFVFMIPASYYLVATTDLPKQIPDAVVPYTVFYLPFLGVLLYFFFKKVKPFDYFIIRRIARRPYLGLEPRKPLKQTAKNKAGR